VQADIEKFSLEVAGLENKLGAVLVQLPPSLAFDAAVANSFFEVLRAHLTCPIVCEPRHSTWFDERSDAILRKHQVGRVAADPALLPAAAERGGDLDCVYFRWHGSPKMYYSAYDDSTLADLGEKISIAAKAAKTVWCVFDNTAAGAATGNALSLIQLLEKAIR
jgi:uncharacterized protein YecE (DUF72 family)